VVDADLEGTVAKHLADAYHPKLAWWPICSVPVEPNGSSNAEGAQKSDFK
jgi:hypothetical protein